MRNEAVFGVREFVARSGMTVREGENGHVKVGLANGYLDRDAVFAIEEWAQAKRDEELGRWRWPENPDWVAVEGDAAMDGRTVVVVNERTLDRFCFNERVMIIPASASAAHKAGCAFFEAHPESKPWHDAAQGEFWSVHHMGMVEVCQVSSGRFIGVDNTVRSRVSMPVTHHSITAAHRLVEEVAS